MTDAELENLFKHHAPINDQAVRYSEMRSAALYFARVIVALTPPGADQTVAIRKVREAMMTANAAIACGETAQHVKVTPPTTQK